MAKKLQRNERMAEMRNDFCGGDLETLVRRAGHFQAALE
jgi:hypothetical protein